MLLRNLQGGHFYWDTVYIRAANPSYGGRHWTTMTSFRCGLQLSSFWVISNHMIGDADPRSTQWPSELLNPELVEFNSRSRYSTAVPIVRGFSRWEKHKESQSLLSIIWQSVSHSLTNNFQRAVHCAQWKYCSWILNYGARTGAGDFSEAFLYSVSSQTQCVPRLQLGHRSNTLTMTNWPIFGPDTQQYSRRLSWDQQLSTPQRKRPG